MEQEACRRYSNAHWEYVAEAVSAFQAGKVNYPESAHWENLEHLRSRKDREKARHERWFRFRCENAGVSVA
jgi:hypothetical protein